MEFGGLQKLTLLDFPGRVACTLFTNGCNLRCPFCHNATLVLRPGTDEISEEEVFAFLEKRRGTLDGVAVTGGEPLLQPWMPEFLRRVRAMGYAVKLDTNGCFPDRLRGVLEEGLADMVAMDVKNSPERYGITVGRENFDLNPVMASVDLLRNSDVCHEFRTTVVKGLHRPEDLAAIGRWLGPVPRYFLQNFKDSGDLLTQGFEAFSEPELDALLAAVRPYVPAAAIRG